MQKVTTIAQLRAVVRGWREQGQTVAFVPTMGNLHPGHIKLVTEAKKNADKVVVSIFVNPTQFAEGEDFDIYPRTEHEDEKSLLDVATDLLFLPSVFEIYPKNASTVVSIGAMSKCLCGAHRVGHFDGVTTVVLKLFNMVQPDYAFFGEKDFQQLSIIKKMVQDLDLTVQIIAVATERHADGLAMSSRNGYLTKQERLLGPQLYKALMNAKQAVLLAEKGFSEIETQQFDRLNQLGFEVEYFSICKQDRLLSAVESDRDLVILVAAKLGKPRLIDNISFSK